jgi:hypothetical protein
VVNEKTTAEMKNCPGHTGRLVDVKADEVDPVYGNVGAPLTVLPLVTHSCKKD